MVDRDVINQTVILKGTKTNFPTICSKHAERLVFKYYIKIFEGKGVLIQNFENDVARCGHKESRHEKSCRHNKSVRLFLSWQKRKTDFTGTYEYMTFCAT